MFYIKRNYEEYGPYSSNQIKEGYKNGEILKRDLIRHNKTNKYINVDEFLSLNNVSIRQNQESPNNILKNIFKLHKVFINPFNYLHLKNNDNSIIYILLGIVLMPVIGLYASSIPIISYIIFGLYFAGIWAVILYKVLGTKQTEIKAIFAVGLITVVVSFVTISLFHKTSLWFLFESHIKSNNLIYKFFSNFFGVAIIEELIKQVVLYLIILNEKKVIIPRTAIFYGMIAGLSFGIFEGIEYQMTLNKTFSVDDNYFLNLIRLTSLPFFHSIWSGIGAYLISLSFILINYKFSFRLLGLFIPAILHAFYNTFELNIFGIMIVVFSSVLLTVVITRSDIVREKLIKI